MFTQAVSYSMRMREISSYRHPLNDQWSKCCLYSSPNPPRNASHSCAIVTFTVSRFKYLVSVCFFCVFVAQCDFSKCQSTAKSPDVLQSKDRGILCMIFQNQTIRSEDAYGLSFVVSMTLLKSYPTTLSVRSISHPLLSWHEIIGSKKRRW